MDTGLNLHENLKSSARYVRVFSNRDTNKRNTTVN